MSAMYYVVYTNDDGETSIEVFDRGRLLAALNDGDYGAEPSRLKLGDRIDCQEHGGLYIIKGESVLPEAKRVVSEWDI